MDAINTPDGFFHPGNPATGQRGTYVTAEWLNGVQGEILAVIADGGQQPDPGNNAQMRDAILALVARRAREIYNEGALPHGVASGDVALTVVPSPGVIELIDGLELRIVAMAANTQRNVTLMVGGLPAKPVVKFGGRQLALADIVGMGHVLMLRYRADVQVFELLNPRTAGTGDEGIQVVSSHWHFINLV